MLTERSVPANTSCSLEDAGLLMPFVTSEPVPSSLRLSPQPRRSLVYEIPGNTLLLAASDPLS